MNHKSNEQGSFMRMSVESRQVRKQIARNLKRAYRAVLSEEIPAEFCALLGKLRRKTVPD